MSLASVSALDSARSTSQSGKSEQVAANGTGQSTGANGLPLRNEFLQMMVAQIQNQDPLNPLDGTQYVSQLAQFSMVEGVESLKVMQQRNIAMQESSQVLSSTALIGKEVMVPGERMTLAKEQPLRGQIELPQGADGVVLKVYDQHGQVVAGKQWGQSKAGTLDYDLPTLPVGQYRFEVTAKVDGKPMSARHYLASEVERVALNSDGQIMLHVAGLGDVPLFSAIQFGKGAA
ncbi:flagellar basal body rod modification protein [Aeromonas diversa CDC 2478-85]|uniref:Basal-body rod modification protein FlgD n=1 Tax=Aeromonas diversa CDC 2478-85 TaxID=1268237 RepID=N9V7Z8_9GAMM|nr:flagellar hook capping FlgD N-terminal domain-containing protein [Aeromonas diversa]ENY71412.1 flagellar basal body rod modification protein [Aeromonas diversa CDC 2478-85]